MNEQNKNEQGPTTEVPKIVETSEHLLEEPAPEYKEVPVPEPEQMSAPVLVEAPVSEPVEVPVVPEVKVIPQLSEDEINKLRAKVRGFQDGVHVDYEGISVNNYNGGYKRPTGQEE